MNNVKESDIRRYVESLDNELLIPVKIHGKSIRVDRVKLAG